MATGHYPPGPRHLFPGQALFAFRRDPTGFLLKLAQTYGDIVYLPLGRRPLYLLNHPDFIRDVLVTHHRNFTKGSVLQASRRVLGEGLLTSEDEAHCAGRRLLQPAFQQQRLNCYAEEMIRQALARSARWQEGVEIDIAQEMATLTLLIAGQVFFGADLSSDCATIQKALDDLLGLFDPTMLPFFELLPWLSFPFRRRLVRAQATLESVIEDLMNKRREEGPGDDLLSLLMQARGGGQGDGWVQNHALTILLAGHETIANALTWTWYLLSEHPQVEARLHAELEDILGESPPQPADAPRLRYTRMVLSEAMRLYPPAWVIAREARRDYEVGGYHIPAGATLLMSQWVMHRDPRYFPSPTTFQPERWLPAQKKKRPPFAYFPFGGGPRVCIGAQFAWLEGVLLLATLAQRWRLHLAPDQAVTLHPRITLRPRQGLRMIPERRMG